MTDDLTFGLLLNTGANLAPTPEGVFDLTRRQAEAGEALGYHDLWVTEHHFIRFGLNPSALVTAGFLLGHTQRVRVGTAVVLSPLHRPVELAEQAALLGQLSEGRFDLGLGRGGYLRDYPALGVDTSRWETEPDASLDAVLALWGGGPVHPDEPDVGIQPPPRAAGAPPLFLATASDRAIATAAAHGVALQHYFATPAVARVAVQDRYVAAGGDPDARHVHHLIAIVTDGEPGARDQLRAALTQSFIDGEHPHVPQTAERHVGPDGKPLPRDALAGMVADGDIIGPVAQVVDELGAFLDATGARRVVLYQEAIADPAITLASIERVATDVVPQLSGALRRATS